MNDKEREMLATINAARAAHGLPAVRPDARLSAAARGHAEDMAAHPGMIHTGSDGSDGGRRILDAGYVPREWLEAVGWGWEGNAAAMVEWWLRSPDHRHILLEENLPDVGVGYADGGPWGHYWTVDFGRTDVPPPQPGYSTVNLPVVLGS